MPSKAANDDFLNDPRFKGLHPSDKRIWLSSPTMHEDEQRYVDEAIRTNWVSTVGENINRVEEEAARMIGRRYAVGLSSGTAALHLAIRLAGERLYGPAAANKGTLEGRKVFCSDVTFSATVNPVAYEGGEPVFIDSETTSWNMSPEALEKAFELYPEVRLIVLVHLYGTPARFDELRAIADRHGALIVEDAAESLGASYRGRQTGTLGDYSIISFNGNKIITGSSGGMFLTDTQEDADKVRKWSTQSRERAPWYQHEELGYNYRMSNIIAGVVRGQLPWLKDHIASKKSIYMRYREGLSGLPVTMNPVPGDSEPNYWLSCIRIDEAAMCPQVRGERDALYRTQPGKSCPTEILNALQAFNAEGRPIWKPMHLQPVFRQNVFISASGQGRGRSNAYLDSERFEDNGLTLFDSGLCLPSDNKMTEEQLVLVIDVIRRCFD